MQNTVVDSKKYQHIAIGIVFRNNYILISKRDKNSHQGDLWEFPGGKVEANETALQALSRELDEELGIRLEYAEPLISIPFTYLNQAKEIDHTNASPETSINVILDVWLVRSFSGRPYSREKQPIKWVNQNQLKNFAFPVANQHIISALYLPDSYVITPDIDTSDINAKEKFIADFKTICQQAYSIIQLRFKKTCLDQVFIKQLCQIANSSQTNLQLNSSSIKLYSNDYAQLGLHLTSRDLYTTQLSQLVKNKSAYFSASCHHLDDIIQANKLKLDFIVLSPVKKTKSHPQAAAIGWQQFEELCKQAQMPVYALGGMTGEDLEKAKLSGAQGIAAISAFWNKETN
jgi:8-oxo-dGTP diphosphatase